VHSEKAKQLKFLTEFGIVTDSRDEQFWKAQLLIVFTELPIVTH
tara:strand:+ start:1909 stop:2040 length:132 start_codon:yes stop_codon:yes gene_type:complete